MTYIHTTSKSFLVCLPVLCVLNHPRIHNNANIPISNMDLVLIYMYTGTYIGIYSSHIDTPTQMYRVTTDM